MAIDHSVGRQLACKVVDLQTIRQITMERLQKFHIIRDTSEEATGTAGALSQMSRDTIERNVKQHTASLSREVEILKDISHVGLIQITFDCADNKDSLILCD